MDTNPHQLFLLSDHIKLSLLERQRADPSSPEAKKQDARIPRLLDTLRSGLETLKQRQFDQQAAGEDTTDLADQISRLQNQYDDLGTQYSAIKAGAEATTTSSPRKSVRFRDNPSSETHDPEDEGLDSSRAALFGRSSQTSYSDDPSSKPYSDHGGPDDDADDPQQLSNMQIHEQHKQTMADQDRQIGLLASSVGRQRELSVQMGQEFASQNAMLDDVEAGVDRHVHALGRAGGRLDSVSRKAKDNWSWLTIAILVLILVLVIVLIK